MTNIYSGKPGRVTPTQARILSMMAEGKTREEIRRVLDLRRSAMSQFLCAMKSAGHIVCVGVGAYEIAKPIATPLPSPKPSPVRESSIAPIPKHRLMAGRA